MTWLPARRYSRTGQRTADFDTMGEERLGMTKTCMWMAIPVTLLLTGVPLAANGQQTLPVPPRDTAAPARRPFTPPADGKLTAEQVKTYIAVRRLATTLAKTKPDETVTDPLAQINRLVAGLNSETSAAEQLGVDIEEYRWVSLQVSAAGVSPAGASLPLGDELVKALLAASGQARAALGPAGTAPAGGGANGNDAAAAAAYNRELLSKFKSELDALGPR
jgi:hypothetical protein